MKRKASDKSHADPASNGAADKLPGSDPTKRPKKNQLTYRLAHQPSASPSANPAATTVLNAGGQPRKHTISMAIPGSIIDNCQSLELKTYVAGQIARAAAIYNIDEIIVYNESPTPMKPDPLKDPNVFLARLLLYQECPQYLRKEFFPVHPSLRFAGLLNPLDAPHHVRVDEKSLYRDGVVLAKKPPGGAASAAGGCLVNCGLRKDVYLAGKVLQPGVRVTVRMRLDETGPSGLPIADPVSRSTPREADGVSWGYTVRLAEGLHNVFAQGPGGNEYDLKIGTSERGITLTHAVGEARRRSEREGGSENVFPSKFKHALIVFGGVKGVEAAIDADEQMHVAAEDAHTLFDHWINTCPGQGSRTIRTEEAVLVSLAVLRPHLLGEYARAAGEMEDAE